MFKRRTLLKSTFSLFLVLEFFVASALPAIALFGGGFSIPSASQMAAELENRYHLNLGSIRDQGEGFNVAGNKALAPEVSLFFSPSDPKPGEKLSAKAFPIYFSNPEETLYYSWYLKRKGCDLENNVGSDNLCDVDEDGDITVEDWKIVAARILAQNGYDKADANYSTNTNDNDGYVAKYGGDNKTNVPNHCYIHDTESGTNYEFVESLSDSNFGCADKTAVCVAEQISVALEEQGGVQGFNPSGTGEYYISGYPTCSSDISSCSIGVLRCADSLSSIATFTAPAGTTCSIISEADANPYCFHFFPNSSGNTPGNGSFGTGEEDFWGTNPEDPSTADNGNKDEANIVGLGSSTFTWNYDSGDQVGVAVEGTSMIPTKHDDSSYMIMWAFPKKDCSARDLAEDIGSYAKGVLGYTVYIPAIKVKDADLDSPLNKCIAYLNNDGEEVDKNLINPTEGGQATKLEVGVTATPDNPVNDETSDKGGDVVVVQASVNNAQHNVTDMLFDWKVEISKDINFNDKLDITAKLRSEGLLGNTKGNALDTLRLKLDIPSSLGGGNNLSDYLNSSGSGYLRFKIAVVENFSGGAIRKGTSDVIVKFTSTGKKISAYKAETALISGVRKATLSGATLICNDDALDRAACRVIKNEIIGLRIDSSGLLNFHWTVNGAPFVCSKKVSGDCSDTQQNNVNFIPVAGSPGDTYTVTVTANDVNTGNALTLSRTFGVVTPAVTLESLDRNIVWPKLLGQYRDITGKVAACPGGLCNDYSTSMFEAFPDSTLGFRATFIPGFLGNISQREWMVDGEAVVESGSREISFTAGKPVGGIYNIALAAEVRQSDETRRALLDIWGISPFDSPEINFSATNQVQLQEPGLVQGPESGPRRYLAAIVSYIPASVMFTFRIFLSAVLALFALGLLYTFLEEQRVRAFVESFSRKNE